MTHAVVAQPQAVLSDDFVVALMEGRVNWSRLQFPTVKLFDRNGDLVASDALTGLRLGADGSAHADSVWLASYTPRDSLLTVEVHSQLYKPVVTLELDPPYVTPTEPFWLVWHAHGIFRP